MPRYVLVLNLMRDRMENATPLAWSSDRPSLVLWMLEQRHVDENGEPGSWKDGRYFKRFKEGSVLEWFNMPDEHAFDAQSGEIYAPNHYGHGIQENPDVEEYLEQQRVQYDQFFAGIADVGKLIPVEERVARLLMEDESS